MYAHLNTKVFQGLWQITNFSFCDDDQLLCNELENVRTEMAEIVETERRLLRESLERESGCIRDQVMELCSKNKSEMISMLKVEVQKRLQTARDKVLLMTDALKQEMDRLKSQLSEAQV